MTAAEIRLDHNMNRLFIRTAGGGRLLSTALRRQLALRNSNSTHCQFRFFSEGGESDRIHSTDIAFKPNASGWGGSNKYESRWDDIFGKNKIDCDDSSNVKSSGEEGGEVNSNDGTKKEHKHNDQ